MVFKYLDILTYKINQCDYFFFRYRVIDTRARFMILHDLRLFTSDLHYIWKRIVNVIFIRDFEKIENHKNQSSWFELSTVPFPSPIRGALVTKRVQTWKTNEIFKPASLFIDKTRNLKGHTLQVVAFQHIPAVVKSRRVGDKAGRTLFRGMEIEVPILLFIEYFQRQS